MRVPGSTARLSSVSSRDLPIGKYYRKYDVNKHTWFCQYTYYCYVIILKELSMYAIFMH